MRRRFEEKIKAEMAANASARGHEMSSYQRVDSEVFDFRSDCARCGAYIELGFGPPGSLSFAPRGGAPFEQCTGRRKRRS